MFGKLGWLIDVLGLSLPRYVPPGQPLGLVVSYGGVILEGDLTFSAGSFYVPAFEGSAGDTVFSLNVSEADDVLVNGSGVGGFGEVAISGVRMWGDFESVFAGSGVILAPPGLGHYARVFFIDGFNLTVRLSEGAGSVLTLRRGGEVLEVRVGGGVFTVGVRVPVEVFMSDVEVRVGGFVRFRRALVTWPYGVLCADLPMEVEGFLGFRVMSMGEGFVFLSNLEIGGVSRVLTQQALQLDEWDIPWWTVLTSPYHIFLVYLVFLGLVFLWVRGKRVGIRGWRWVRAVLSREG
jgi:hypothetical protein